jgi:D-proline reductase (dithiol) PrdB
MSDAIIRARAADMEVPAFDVTPFVTPPALDEACVAIVTTAALRLPGEQLLRGGDHSFRVIGPDDQPALGHGSPNFDRTGWLLDSNVVFPVDRLRELAAGGVIGSVAPRHLSFAGNQLEETLTSIRLDSGPAAGALLTADGVDVVVLTPV